MARPTDVPAWLRAALEATPRPMAPEDDRLSAVLLPVVVRVGGPTVLFVRKSAHLFKHAGQLGFPGGGIERGESVAAAALREAWEEIGLEPARVTLLGRLDEERTFATAFHITPLVGWIAEPPAAWTIDPGEIETVHEVPLLEVVDTEPVSWLEFTAPMGEGRAELHTFRAPRYEFASGVVVWGASARILRNLQERLRAAR